MPASQDHPILRQCPALTKQHVRTALPGLGLLTARRVRDIRSPSGKETSSETQNGKTCIQIIYHPQSGWFEDTPLKGGTEAGYPLKGVEEGTSLLGLRSVGGTTTALR